MESDTEKYSPCEDTDVVGVRQCVNWIVNDVHDDVVENFDDAGWRSNLCVRNLELELCRKQEGCRDCNKRSEERADDVQRDNRLHCVAGISVFLCHGVHDENEYEYRGDALQSLDEKITENLNGRNCLWCCNCQYNTDNQADGNKLYKCRFLVPPTKRT